MADVGGSEQSSAVLLRQRFDALIDEAQREAQAFGWYARFWNIVDLLTGAPAAVLAAVSGVTGLATTAGRLPAAVLALAAAAFAAGAAFLRSRSRYERSHRHRRAWRALEWDAQVARAYHSDSSADALYAVLEQLGERRRRILNDGPGQTPDATV